MSYASCLVSICLLSSLVYWCRRVRGGSLSKVGYVTCFVKLSSFRPCLCLGCCLCSCTAITGQNTGIPCRFGPLLGRANGVMLLHFRSPFISGVLFLDSRAESFLLPYPICSIYWWGCAILGWPCHVNLPAAIGLLIRGYRSIVVVSCSTKCRREWWPV